MKRHRIIAAATIALFVVAVFAVIASGMVPYRLYIVHTGSMAPTFQSTSAVIVRTGEYRVGKPITFDANGEIVTHRLVSVSQDGTIVTKGDANATDDPWRLTTKAIIGGVVADVPHLGYWLQFLKNPLGLVAILLAAAVCWQLWTLTETNPRDARPDTSPRFRHRASGPRHSTS